MTLRWHSDLILLLQSYKEPVRESLKALLALGWSVEHTEVDMPSNSRSSQFVRGESSNAFDYNPHPVDMTNLTLSREMQNMGERLAENAHDIWARKKREELITCGGTSIEQVVFKETQLNQVSLYRRHPSSASTIRFTHG